MKLFYCFDLLIAGFMALTAAQQGDTIWGAVIVSTFGDRIPLLSPNYSTITSLGAQQMHNAGSLFRNRYISPSKDSPNLTINGISQEQIDNTETYAYTLDTIYVDQSAQAFMAGLYPPLSNSNNLTSIMAARSQTMAENTTIPWPNNGMQYPLIYSTGANDYMDIYLEGMSNCPTLAYSIQEFYESSAFRSMVSSTSGFYQQLSSDFSAALPQDYVAAPWNLSYYDAYTIWDYISYQSLHNASAGIDDSNVQEARYLADAWSLSLYGNNTDPIRTMGGRTLLGFVLKNLANNIDTDGSQFKLTNLFTDYQPIISLFSLLGILDADDQFRGIPNVASSVSFEIFTNSSLHIPNPSSVPFYPSTNDLQIRFLFRNGSTDSDDSSLTGLNEQAIFGNNGTTMSFVDFANAVEGVMQFDPADWCLNCQADAVFCASLTNGSVGLTSGPVSAPSHQVSPVVAGVIGALVALAVAGILFLVAMLVFGIRFRRIKAKRRSELGGFKGSEKLASDRDLPSQRPGDTKDGTFFGASIIPSAADSSSHKRIESWELREGRGSTGEAREIERPSMEHDDESRIKAVEAIERV